MKHTKQRAFTLLEILVALLIMAIIAVILVMGLRSVINTKDRIEDVSQRLANMQIAMSIISNDIHQIVNRSVYDNDGQPLYPVMLYSGIEQRIEFTRLGFVNPLGMQQRSTLQRVTYRLVNNELQRGTWQVLDRASSSKPSYQVLLKNVTNVQWQFLSNDLRNYPTWPAPNISANQPLPKAIELTITIRNWGTLHRWIILNSYHRLIGESTSG